MKSKKDLSAILSKLKKEQEDKKQSHSGNYGDMYPFWNIDVGTDNKATIRIVPHKGMTDENDIEPFVSKLEHVLSINGEDKKIPCMRMYDEKCPICALSDKYYKAEGKGSAKGKYYWRDKKSLASAYIVNDPLAPDEETGENNQGKIKVVQLGNQLSRKYESRWKALFKDGEIDDLPWDLENGLDFHIVKDKSGEYFKYDTNSDFARKQTSLPADVIENFEPVDLTKYLPKNPGLDKVQRMLDAHVTGEEYVDEDTETSDTKTDKSAAFVSKNKKAVTESKKSPIEEEIEDDTPDVVIEDSHSDADSIEEDEEDDDDDFIAQLKRRSSAK